MRLIINFFSAGFAVFMASYFMPGVKVDNYLTSITIAALFGIGSLVIEGILVTLNFPVTILSLIANAFLILLISTSIKGFFVENFLTAIIFCFVVTVISAILNKIAG